MAAWAATLVAFLCRAALGVATSLGLIAVGPALVGLQSTVVMSDSMAPGIRAGDVVVVRAVPVEAVRPGKVVLVDAPDRRDRLRLHRVVGIEPDGFVLQGDANAQPDSARIAPAAIHGVGFLRVPWIGLPVLWLRTGQPVLLAAALAGTVAAALAVALLDPPQRGTGGTPGRAARLLRLRRVRAGGAAVGIAVLAAALPHGTAATTSWAAFSGTTTASNSLRTGTWACPALPSPAPEIAYSFMAASGTPEANRGGLSGYGATLSSASMRVTGTCTGDSPFVRFSGSGSDSVTGGSALPQGAQGSQSVWFSPAAASGVIVGLHSTSDATAAGADRQMYFTSAGRLAYAMRSGSSVVTCSIDVAVTLDAWHFAAVTYSTSTKVFTLYLDGTDTACTGTVTTASTGSGTSRIGADTAIAADASSAAYRGGIDEVYAWSALLTPAQVAAARANGR